VEAFDWPDACARVLKGEIARAGITLARLAQRLERLGVHETEVTLKNKLYRGTFSMALFIQCMRALGHVSVDLGAVFPPEMPKGSELDLAVQSAITRDEGRD
jgi:hypothetical protein